jgi:hypothetical protein
VSTITHSARRKSRPLFEAGKLRCPHDKSLHDILSYKNFDLPSEFFAQLNSILRCEYCGHIFSPALSPVEMNMIKEAFDNYAD